MKTYQQHLFVYKSLFRYCNKHCCQVYILESIGVDCRLCGVAVKTWLLIREAAGSIPGPGHFFLKFLNQLTNQLFLSILSHFLTSPESEDLTIRLVKM